MDVVVTVPKPQWAAWLAEGCLPGQRPPKDTEYVFSVPAPPRRIEPGERVYIVAHGRLRGYSPLVRVWDNFFGGPFDERSDRLTEMRLKRQDEGRADEFGDVGGFWLVRKGGAVAVTIRTPIPGFRGFRYRWWDRADEVPFPEWTTP